MNLAFIVGLCILHASGSFGNAWVCLGPIFLQFTTIQPRAGGLMCQMSSKSAEPFFPSRSGRRELRTKPYMCMGSDRDRNTEKRGAQANEFKET